MAVSQFFRGPLEPGYSMSWHRLTAAADLGKQMVGERTTAFHATETGRLALGYDRNGAFWMVPAIEAECLLSLDLADVRCGARERA
jgi:hypothetical protein